MRGCSGRDPRLSGLALALLIVGCRQPTPPPEEPVRPVKIHEIGSLQPAAFREYPGTIRAFQTAEMGFEVSGRVTEFLVREGDRVEKDAVLARLDARDYLAQLKAAQANLEKAQADLARSENIYQEDPGAISLDDIERDRRAAKVTEAMLEIAQKAVDDTELRAPFSGVMARKLVEDFVNIQAKEPVLILQDDARLEIEVAVPERDFVRRKTVGANREELTARLSPKVRVSSLPDREFDAELKELTATADPVTRTFTARLNFDNPDDVSVLPGMTARVRIVVDPESAYSVPVSAVQSDSAEKPFVWKVNPQTMRVARTHVELGRLSGDRLMLVGGVAQGDWVAISGVARLREGMQVRRYSQSPTDAP